MYIQKNKMLKVFILLVCYLSIYAGKGNAAALVPLKASSPFTELSPSDRAELAFLRQYSRAKRSGSGDILNTLKSSLGESIKSKLSLLAKGSSSASGHFSSGSSHHPHYYHESEGHKPFDIWTFKKSVLYTLLQAVKAIKGGVIAIKGQLIKGGGHLLTAKGKLIRGGGEALTNIGKSIATSAFVIVPHEPEHHSPEHYEYDSPHSYVSDSHHSAPSAPAAEYGHPSGYSSKYNSVYGGKHEHDGIVILKKIPHEQGLRHEHESGHEHGPGHEHGHGHGPGHEQVHEHEVQESQTPDFKPLSNNVAYPDFKTFVGSMFSASSNTESDVKHYDLDEYAKHGAPSIQIQTHSKPEGNYHAPPSTNYGTPIGPAVKYAEYFNSPSNTFALHQKNSIQKHNVMFVTPSPEYQTPLEHKTPLEYQTPEYHPLEYQTLLGHQTTEHQTSEHQTSLGHQIALKHQTPLTFKLEMSPSAKDKPKLYLDMATLLETYPSPNKEHFDMKSNSKPNAKHHNFKDAGVATNFDLKLSPTPYSEEMPTKFLINYPDPAPSTKFTKQQQHVKAKRPQNLDIVRSIAFELGPNGPVKITN